MIFLYCYGELIKLHIISQAQGYQNRDNTSLQTSADLDAIDLFSDNLWKDYVKQGDKILNHMFQAVGIQICTVFIRSIAFVFNSFLLALYTASYF